MLAELHSDILKLIVPELNSRGTCIFRSGCKRFSALISAEYVYKKIDDEFWAETWFRCEMGPSERMRFEHACKLGNPGYMDYLLRKPQIHSIHDFIETNMPNLITACNPSVMKILITHFKNGSSFMKYRTCMAACQVPELLFHCAKENYITPNDETGIFLQSCKYGNYDILKQLYRDGYIKNLKGLIIQSVSLDIEYYRAFINEIGREMAPEILCEAIRLDNKKVINTITNKFGDIEEISLETINQMSNGLTPSLQTKLQNAGYFYNPYNRGYCKRE
jgi:hypothetical protein